MQKLPLLLEACWTLLPPAVTGPRFGSRFQNCKARAGRWGCVDMLGMQCQCDQVSMSCRGMRQSSIQPRALVRPLAACTKSCMPSKDATTGGAKSTGWYMLV